MHNRNMIWTTADGKRIKIKDITSSHLLNILKHINKNIDIFNSKYSAEKINKCIFNINQEIRFRKLNRIKMNEEESKLF